MSLMAGLVFGGISAYGAYNITNDSKDIKVLMCEYGQVQFKMNFQRIINVIQLVLCCNVSSGLRNPCGCDGHEIQEIW